MADKNDTSAAHMRYAEEALAADHAQHRDVADRPADAPATTARDVPTPNADTPRPAWANARRSV